MPLSLGNEPKCKLVSYFKKAITALPVTNIFSNKNDALWAQVQVAALVRSQ